MASQMIKSTKGQSIATNKTRLNNVFFLLEQKTKLKHALQHLSKSIHFCVRIPVLVSQSYDKITIKHLFPHPQKCYWQSTKGAFLQECAPSKLLKKNWVGILKCQI